MKKLLLLLAVMLLVANVYAQTPLPITGATTVCRTYTTSLSDATPGGVWSSSNSLIASIVPGTGVVTGVSFGVALISYSVGPSYVTIPVSVNPLPTAISGPATFCTGGTATYLNGTAGGAWSTSFVSLASIGTSGVATGTAGGSDTIIYTLPTGCFTKLQVTINSTAISGVTSLCLGAGGSTLTDATPGGVWTSSNPAVATIGATTGNLNGITAGAVGITYTIGPSCVGYTTAFVRALPVVTPASLSGCVGSTYLYTGNPGGGGWTSSNPTVATVNFVGAVTGLAPGSSTIMYTAPGGCQSSATININALPLPISGVAYVNQGFTTLLSEITPGGLWSTTNPSIATVLGVGLTGTVTGVSSGLGIISYTIPATGCGVGYRVEVDPLPGGINLVGWYPFCDSSVPDIADHSGLGHNLLAVGIPPVLAPDRFANPNSAFDFNGTNLLEYSTFFPNSGTPNDFTYSCWIKPTVPQLSIIWFNGDINTDGFGLIMNDGSGFPGAAGTNVSAIFPGTATPQPITTGITLGIWNNVVLVKNGNFYFIYVNNGPPVFASSAFIPMSVGSVFGIGSNAAAGPTYGFIGSIDDVAVIEKQLTAAERSAAYFFNPDAIKFSLGNDTVVCSDNIRLAPNPQTPGALYTWKTFTTGFGYVVTDTANTSVIRYPVTGIIGNSYSLTISKPRGCTLADTIIVYKSPLPVNLGPDKYICIGDTITLSSYFPSSSFLWSTGDTTHSISVTTTGVYYVTIDSVVHLSTTDSTVCVGRDTIFVQASPVPIITVPAHVSNCVGNPVTAFTHFDPTYTYLWSTGVTVDSSVLAVTGTYWLQVRTNAGCIRSDTVRAVIVDERVTLNNIDTAICKGDLVPARSTYNPLVTYQWTPTAGMAVSNAASVTIVPDTSAEYFLTVSYPGCPNLVDSFFLDVQPIPVVNIGGNREVCEGDTLHITATFSPAWYQRYHFAWTPVNARTDTADSSTIVFHAITSHDSEEIYVKVYPPAYSTVFAPQCYAIDSAAIFVHPAFHSVLAKRLEFCPGDSIQLSAVPDSLSKLLGVTIASAKWSPGVYLEDSTSLTTWLHPITSVDYRLTAYSQFGCADTEYLQVVVHAAAILNLGDSVVLSPGDSVHIQPQTNCVTFDWFPPFGLDNPHLADPTAKPAANTTYKVHASTEDGCTVTDSIRIRVDPGTLINLPNAFTPGSSFNNKFTVIKRGLVALNYFRVFDRWGVKMFETTNISDGWNGEFNNKPQPFGVYVYDVEAVTSTGKIFHRQGNVTLIR